jgi:hypothetical protein
MKLENAQSLDRILECAVIVSWADLMKDAKSGLIHLEYAFSPDSSFEYLKLWSSMTRGHWRLACEFWMSASTLHDSGIHFEDGFQSEGLTQALEFIMQHQQAFSPSPDSGRTALLQIRVPTEEESTTAAKSLREALCRVNSFSPEPAVA